MSSWNPSRQRRSQWWSEPSPAPQTFVFAAEKTSKHASSPRRSLRVASWRLAILRLQINIAFVYTRLADLVLRIMKIEMAQPRHWVAQRQRNLTSRPMPRCLRLEVVLHRPLRPTGQEAIVVAASKQTCLGMFLSGCQTVRGRLHDMTGRWWRTNLNGWAWDAHATSSTPSSLWAFRLHSNTGCTRLRCNRHVNRIAKVTRSLQTTRRRSHGVRTERKGPGYMFDRLQALLLCWSGLPDLMHAAGVARHR